MHGVPDDLAARALSYDCVGATMPASEVWTERPEAYRAFERDVSLGSGPDRWAFASDAVMTWGIKTRSGFDVTSGDGSAAGPVRAGDDHWLIARLGPFVVREPVRIVATVQTDERVGFAYGTLEGHPVAGEEAFVVHRRGDEVRLLLRSLTRRGNGIWAIAFPGVLVAQRVYRRRYLVALAQV